MRNLNNKDLFTLARIMRKADLKDSIKNMGIEENINDNQLMVMLIFEVINSAPQAEKEIFAFLADIAGVKSEEIENDEFELLTEIIEHLKGQEKLTAFLQQAFKLAN